MVTPEIDIVKFQRELALAFLSDIRDALRADEVARAKEIAEHAVESITTRIKQGR